MGRKQYLKPNQSVYTNNPKYFTAEVSIGVERQDLLGITEAGVHPHEISAQHACHQPFLMTFSGVLAQ